ncbi:MAG: hypothetical protein MJ048_05810, partial [Acidaminococcaceae bacterium]|nr:hypothetical protein [Acidaminococcaceae bacterium]
IEDGTFNNVNLYGGYAGASTSSNNTLNLKIKMGGKQNEVKYFQNMNFYLPSDITNGDIMMETTSVAYDNTTIGVTAANGVQLNIDDKIYLIKSDAATGTISNDGAKVLGGTAIISLVGNDLILTYLGIGEDQQKAPVEGIATAMAMVNQCADLASREGMESLLITTEGGKFEPFAAANGGHSKYKTGSHIDVNGWVMLV